MGRIDDDMIQDVEALRHKKKRSVWMTWGTLAACLCLVVASMYLIPKASEPSSQGPPVPSPDGTIQRAEMPGVYPSYPILRPGDEGYVDPGPEPIGRWAAYFNEARGVVSKSRAYIKGYFTEHLNDIELAALEPEIRFEHMTCSGYAGFDNYGNLLEVIMTVTTSLPDNPVTIFIADDSFASCYEMPGEVIVSPCETVEYRVYQYDSGKAISLGADAIINDITFHFSMETNQLQLEQAKVDFQHVLECFARYEKGKPDLSLITPEEIPELTEQMFHTLSEARSEPDFGRYLPSELPDGFGEADIYRFKFQNSNFLSGLWSRGLDDLNWVVSPYTEENKHRITNVNDKENYDLSLYPIPRADSVPDELRDIVDNPIFNAEELTLEAVCCRAYKVNDAGDTDGWRMRFSVKYGDVIVAVNTKGVEPEWLYRQLKSLISD